jgi:hypothetical protein
MGLYRDARPAEFSLEIGGIRNRDPVARADIDEYAGFSLKEDVADERVLTELRPMANSLSE